MADNTLALMWQLGSDPIETEIANALVRFSQRRELAGRTPQRVMFRTGSMPATPPKTNLTIDTADNVPAGCIFIY